MPAKCPACRRAEPDFGRQGRETPADRKIKGRKHMGKLDFLYRMELPHRAVAVYIYLSDRANQEG